MTIFYGFVAPGELASQHDPIRVLRTALSEGELQTNRSYDPNRTSLWSRADVVSVAEPAVDILNQQTGQQEPALICTLDTQ